MHRYLKEEGEKPELKFASLKRESVFKCTGNFQSNDLLKRHITHSNLQYQNSHTCLSVYEKTESIQTNIVACTNDSIDFFRDCHVMVLATLRHASLEYRT